MPSGQPGNPEPAMSQASPFSRGCYLPIFQKEICMKITAAFLSLFFIFGLAACNTIEGAGKDVEAAGDAVEDTARENKNY